MSYLFIFLAGMLTAIALILLCAGKPVDVSMYLTGIVIAFFFAWLNRKAQGTPNGDKEGA